MKYFIKETERKGTCYHEFQKGKWDGKTFWHKDSLLIHDDIFFDLKLGNLFAETVSGYISYGETEISMEQWEAVYNKAESMGGGVKAAMEELKLWAEQNFQTEQVFTILGI